MTLQERSTEAKARADELWAELQEVQKEVKPYLDKLDKATAVWSRENRIAEALATLVKEGQVL